MFFNTMTFSQIKGKVIGEPELKETRSGKKLLTFNFLYFTRQSTDTEGSHANFIQVECWQKVAELCAPMIVKGQYVIVNGIYVQKRWTDENGRPRSNFIFSAEAVNITSEQSEPENEHEELGDNLLLNAA